MIAVTDESIKRAVEQFMERKGSSDFVDEPSNVDRHVGTLIQWPPAPPLPAAQPEPGAMDESTLLKAQPDVELDGVTIDVEL